MIKELHIQNYRLFKDFKIKNLGQVNLIAGKNNTGKTSFLEALMLYESRGDNYFLAKLISTIIENRVGKNNGFTRSELIASIIYLKQEKDLSIKINDLILQTDFNKNTKKINGLSKVKNLTLATQLPNSAIKETLTLFDNKIKNYILSDYYGYVSSSIEHNNNIRWHKIALRPEEDIIIDALKIIEPRVIRLNIQNDNAIIRLKGNDKPSSINSLGDGINRLLTIALEMVAAKGSVLLIDEFETGLHHSIQEKVWDFIFQLSKKLNIQVFATTHSKDCLEAFYEIASKKDYENMGKYFRLERDKKLGIKPISVNMRQLKTAILHDLEIR